MSAPLAESRVGVFGGTFDPLHTGHLIAAQAAFEALDLDRLLLVPARRSPHKDTGPVASPDARRRMLEASIRGDERFVVETTELDRPGPSYSVDTLRAVSERTPAPFLIIGVDQWAALGHWHDPDRIVELARIAVMTRSGEAPEEVDPGFGGNARPPFVRVAVPRIDISASMIRDRRGRGLPIRYLVPDPVHRIIEDENLYS